MTTKFSDGKCKISKNGTLLASGEQCRYLGSLSASPVKSERTHDAAHIASMQRWNERLCHVHSRAISAMVRAGVVNGIDELRKENEIVCESLISGKPLHTPIRKVRVSRRSSKPLELLHSDVCGPMIVESMGPGNSSRSSTNFRTGLSCSQ